MIYVLIVSQFPEFPHSKPRLPFPICTNIYGLLYVNLISYQQKCQYDFHRTYLEHFFEFHFFNFLDHLNFVLIFSSVNKFSQPVAHYVLSNQPIADQVRFYSFIVLFRGQVDSQFQVFCLLSYPLYSKPL